MKIQILKDNLEKLGYKVSVFENKEQACEYIDNKIDKKTVGFGGSVTIKEMNLFDKLNKHNTVYWHMNLSDMGEIKQTRKDAVRSQVYISSVNAISLKGEIVNIDNTGNRVAAATFGCDDVYFVIGQNKISETLEDAIYRARNVAAPLNAKRLCMNTPCAIKADKCYDCDSNQRICRNLSIFLKKPTGCEYEVILIAEDLGF